MTRFLFSFKLTGNDQTSIQEPFNSHGRITDGFDTSFKVDFSAFSLVHVTKWDNELGWWIDAVFLHWCGVWLSTFNVTQIDDFGFKWRSRNIFLSKHVPTGRICKTHSGSMTRVGFGKCIALGSKDCCLVVSTNNLARVAVEPATF